MKPQMTYKQAVEWIVLNDHPEGEIDEGWISVCLVADIYNEPASDVLRDVFCVSRELEARDEE